MYLSQYKITSGENGQWSYTQRMQMLVNLFLNATVWSAMKAPTDCHVHGSPYWNPPQPVLTKAFLQWKGPPLQVRTVLRNENFYYKQQSSVYLVTIYVIIASFYTFYASIVLLFPSYYLTNHKNAAEYIIIVHLSVISCLKKISNRFKTKPPRGQPLYQGQRARPPMCPLFYCIFLVYFYTCN